MKVIQASSAGFCKGVRIAVEKALNTAAATPPPIFTDGPLIHNPGMLQTLESRGVSVADDPASLPEGATLLIRAHGISPEHRHALQALPLRLVDATCPEVARIQAQVRIHVSRGYDILIFGDAGHAEVEGLLGHAKGHGHVVEKPDDLDKVPSTVLRVCLVAQSTQCTDAYAAMANAVRRHWPDAVVLDTICDATKRRQAELAELAAAADRIVVVGSPQSANSRRLAEIASRLRPALLVENADALRPEDFAGVRAVGLTAGASTPDDVLQSVRARLESFPSDIPMPTPINASTAAVSTNSADASAAAQPPAAPAPATAAAQPAVCTTKSAMRNLVRTWHREGLSVALVPTMGALHEGHLSLMRIARKNADRVIVSIFVNPIQFGPNEDFDAYPRTEDEDIRRCGEEGVDAVFLPKASEMYAPDATVAVEENDLTTVLCGAQRPGHFRGVMTVVAKLFHIAQPDVAVFGQKDAQQFAVIERMVRDLDFGIRLIRAPISREADGLARSSRNRYLTPAQRAVAPQLHAALVFAEQAYAAGSRDASSVVTEMRARLSAIPEAKIDYVEAVNFATLRRVATLAPNTLVAVAVRIGTTRLIDNTILE